MPCTCNLVITVQMQCKWLRYGQISRGGGAHFFQIVIYEQVTAGQYIEIMWLPENVGVTIDFTAAGAIAPAVPSVILAAERIA